jgi:hypothetical protein
MQPPPAFALPELRVKPLASRDGEEVLSDSSLCNHASLSPPSEHSMSPLGAAVSSVSPPSHLLLTAVHRPHTPPLRQNSPLANGRTALQPFPATLAAQTPGKSSALPPPTLPLFIESLAPLVALVETQEVQAGCFISYI